MKHATMTIHIRLAVSADIPVLRTLIDASVRGLQKGDYTPSQIESALATVYGVDTQLIADGTYFVAEDESDAGDAAKIRAFFIQPSWTRRGIGTMILEACENAAIDAGFARFEMGATLTGLLLYQARGYVAIENLEVPLGNGESLPIVRMEKQITKPVL